MRTARIGVGRAVGCVLLALVLPVCHAAAGEVGPWPDAIAVHDASFPDDRTRLAFTGGDVSPNAYALWTGFDLSDGGLERSGLRLRVVAGEGAYLAGHPRLAEVHALVDKSFGVLSIGGAHVAKSWRAAAFLGLGFDARVPDIAGLNASDTGTRLGLDLSAELWAEPTRSTRLAVSASFGTARGAWAVRSFVGLLVRGLLVGPELIATGNPEGHEARIGLAVSGPLIESIEGRLSCGFATGEDGDGGGYVTVSLWRRW